ncbi:MAG: hypothetical protein M1834_005541 [Cirrosporium novae-zelandiae]|nr:MAG: hypothetical protein M1834_005541 [Cirrosporium novae-zelandiae]
MSVYLVYLVLVTTLGPLQFGYHLAELNAPESVIRCQKKSIVISGAAVKIHSTRSPQCIPMSAAQFGLVTSIYTLGGLLGALAAGPVSTRHGRLYAMRLTTLFFIIGPVLEALAPSIPFMVLGRIISGIGAGASIVIVPLYIAEIAPPDKKGLFGAMTQIMTNVGILIAQLLGYFLSYDSYWRIILAVAGGIALAQLAGLFYTPESPRWLAEHNRAGLARRVLQKVRGHSVDISEEVSEWGIHGTASDSNAPDEENALLTNPDNEQPTYSKHTHNPPVGFFAVIQTPPYSRAVYAVIGIMVAQQLTGINSIVMYSVSILTTILPAAAPMIAVFVSVVNLFVTTLCSPLADKLGRKRVILISIAGMGINSFLLAFGIYYNIRPLSAVATLLFVASFATGLGPVPFILASELVGPEAVGATQSWALAANWISTFVVAQGVPMLNEVLNRGRMYFLFAAMAVLFGAFIAIFVPETKGKKDADEVWGRVRRED